MFWFCSSHSLYPLSVLRYLFYDLVKIPFLPILFFIFHLMHNFPILRFFAFFCALIVVNIFQCFPNILLLSCRLLLSLLPYLLDLHLACATSNLYNNPIKFFFFTQIKSILWSCLCNVMSFTYLSSDAHAVPWIEFDCFFIWSF